MKLLIYQFSFKEMMRAYIRAYFRKSIRINSSNKREEILNNWIKISYVENNTKEFPIEIFIGIIIFFTILFNI